MAKRNYIVPIIILFWSFLHSSLFSQTNNSLIAVHTPSEHHYAKKKNNTYLLSDFLKELEKEFQVYILFESELLENIKISTIDISYGHSIEDQLQKILQSTHLDFVKVADNTFVIIRSKKSGYLFGKILDKNNQPLIGATIRKSDSNTGVVADLDGKYKFTLAPGIHFLEVSYVGFSPEIIEVEVPPGDSIVINTKLRNYPNLNEVVIVGSRFSESSLLNKIESATVVKKEEFNSSGQAETAQMLQFTLPSFHSTPQTISDGTDHIDPATLRGLGPDQLLVLINGKRRHHSALVNINGTIGKGTVATDLNAIPASAIERIEVLKDGASTQYGSDAIAGVINIVLKKNTNFAEVNLTSGITQEGDGKTFQLNGNYGTNLGNRGGFLNLTLNFLSKEGVNRSGNYEGTIFGDGRDEDKSIVDAFFQQTGYKDRRVMEIGGAAASNAAMFLNAEYPINHKTKLYAFGGTSYRMGTSTGFYRFPFQKERQSGIFPMGFSPKLRTNIFDKSFTFGVHNKNLPFQIDLSNTFGSNSFDFRVNNSNNASLGLLSPTKAYVGGFTYNQNVTNLDLSKKFEGKIPTLIGFGSEFRLENYRQKAGETASYIDGQCDDSNGHPKQAGFQLFPGFQPENEVNEYRHNLGIYINGESEITKSWQVTSALRFEHYSDFGSNTTWKLGTRYTLKKGLTIRGNYNTGFRAPSMPQVHFSSIGFQYISQGNELMGSKVAHFNNQNNVTTQFGINSLKAERSKNFSLGLTAQILKNLSFTFDFYEIDINDRIVITGRFSKDNALHFAEILEPTGVSTAQFFTNAINTRTKGIDLQLRYNIDFGANTLQLSAASNFNKTRIKRDDANRPVINTSEQLQGFETLLFNREEVSRIEVAQPNHKSIFRANLKMKKMEWMLATIYFGEVKYIHPEDGIPSNWVLNELTGRIESRDQTFSPKWTTDFSYKYHFTNRLAISIGGNNIFNIYPDQHTHSANIVNGLFQYSRRVQQFGVRGAYWYGSLNYKF